MTNANIALARRFWMHVHEGGTLTTLDVGRMVTAMEELDAAFTNLHREYDKRGDRIEELEAKLAQQDDLVQAAVAAKLKEAADLSALGFHPRDILALIPEHAQAALDRVVAEVLTQAADAVEDYCSDAPDLAGHGHSGAIRDVIASIRKGGE